MTKTQHLIATILATSLFVPVFVLAQTVSDDATGTSETSISTTTPSTSTSTIAEASTSPSQIYTACIQSSIEKRDSAIQAANDIYNKTKDTALAARTEAEKAAATIDESTNEDGKRSALQEALDAYKGAIEPAQTALEETKQSARDDFKVDIKVCLDAKKITQTEAVLEKKDIKEDVRIEKKLEKASTTAIKKIIKEEKKSKTTITKEIKKIEKASTTEAKTIEKEEDKVETKTIGESLKQTFSSWIKKWGF